MRNSHHDTLTDKACTLRDAMRYLVSGVAVVTAGTGDERAGLTITSARSGTIDPDTMVVSINRSSSAIPIIERHRHFCVNLLKEAQEPVAARFAGRDGLKGSARYDGAKWVTLSTGALALDGALASIDCVVEALIPHHSHLIVLGLVRAVRVSPGRALVYSNGRFGSYAVEEHDSRMTEFAWEELGWGG